MQKNSQLVSSLLLLLTAFIWGTAFVAQSTGGDVFGPFTFNCVRNFIGAGALTLLMPLLDKLRGPQVILPDTPQKKKQLLKAGLCCGTALCVASNLQQVGISMGSSTGKAGFLTALYILIVPLMGLALGRRCGWNVWAGVGIAVVGFYLLCMSGSFTLQPSDLLLIGCAFTFSLQILFIEYFAPVVDGVRLSRLQFLVVGLLTAIPALFVELPAAGAAAWLGCFTQPEGWLALLYAGILSSGVAYTLQIIAQAGLESTVASLLMSLESVFSALAGWVLLHQVLSGRELLGCGLIFAAVILAQLTFGKKQAAAG